MLETFGSVAHNFKLKPQSYIIDNWIFKLHYKASALIFLVSSLLVCSRQYIGEHIKCLTAKEDDTVHFLNTYCFFTPTFTVVKHLNASLMDSGYLAHPGVGPYGINSDEPIMRYAYYQWVPFVLFLQAIMFCVTHVLWKKLESGRLKYLVDGLKFAAFSLTEEQITVQDINIPSRKAKEEKIKIFREAFLARIYINKSWSIKLISCEVMNLLHVVLQIYITNKFLHGNFYHLGIKIVNDGLESSVDVLDMVFPKVTKCTFYKYGPSGSLQLHDVMCVMALNVINEKIYTFLWFWFVFLFVCSALGLVWRLLTLCLYSKSKRFNRMVFSNTCPGKLSPWNVLTVSKRCNYTDWLFLRYLSKNIDGMVFREIFVGLAEEVEKDPSKFTIFVNHEGSKSD